MKRKIVSLLLVSAMTAVLAAGCEAVRGIQMHLTAVSQKLRLILKGRRSGRKRGRCKNGNSRCGSSQPGICI